LQEYPMLEKYFRSNQLAQPFGAIRRSMSGLRDSDDSLRV